MNPNGTRGQIVTTAAELIWRRGYSRTSVDEIIKETGVCKGTFYHHFSSKESLGLAVIGAWIDDLRARVERSLSEARPPVENLYGILDAIVAAQREAGYLGCPLGRLALEMGDVSERFRQRLQEGFDRFRGLFATHLERGGMAAAEASDVAHYLLATLEGALMLGKVAGDAGVLDGLIAAMKSDVSRRLMAVPTRQTHQTRANL